jgi:hypothetical protein
MTRTVPRRTDRRRPVQPVPQPVVEAVPDPEPEFSEPPFGTDMDTIADLLEMQNRMDLPGGIIFGLVQLSADKARMLLDANARNRRVSDEQVNTFARMMAAGKWLFNGATMALGADGVMQDGQHRCMAVIEADVSIPTMVMLGLPPEAQEVTDTGRRRSGSDALTLSGVPNSANAAAMVRLLLAWYAGRVLHSGYTVGNIEILEFVRAQPEAVNEAVTVAMRARGNGVPISTSALSAVYFRLSGMAEVDQADIDEFFTRVCEGVGLVEGDPELALRRMVMRRHGAGARTGRAEGLYYIIAAWNSRARGERREKLQQPRGGLRAETFPELAVPVKAADPA